MKMIVESSGSGWKPLIAWREKMTLGAYVHQLDVMYECQRASLEAFKETCHL